MSQWYAWCPKEESGCGYTTKAQDDWQAMLAKVVADGGRVASCDSWDNTPEPTAPGLVILTCPNPKCKMELRRAKR